MKRGIILALAATMLASWAAGCSMSEPLFAPVLYVEHAATLDRSKVAQRVRQSLDALPFDGVMMAEGDVTARLPRRRGHFGIPEIVGGDIRVRIAEQSDGFAIWIDTDGLQYSRKDGGVRRPLTPIQRDKVLAAVERDLRPRLQ